MFFNLDLFNKYKNLALTFCILNINENHISKNNHENGTSGIIKANIQNNIKKIPKNILSK
jgi:hypothetical protein